MAGKHAKDLVDPVERDALTAIGVTDLCRVDLRWLSEKLQVAFDSCEISLLQVLTVYAAWLRDQVLDKQSEGTRAVWTITNDWCRIVSRGGFDKGIVLACYIKAQNEATRKQPSKRRDLFNEVKMTIERAYPKIRAPESDTEASELRLQLMKVIHGRAWDTSSTPPLSQQARRRPSDLQAKPRVNNSFTVTSDPAELPLEQPFRLTGANIAPLGTGSRPRSGLTQEPSSSSIRSPAPPPPSSTTMSSEGTDSKPASKREPDRKLSELSVLAPVPCRKTGDKKKSITSSNSEGSKDRMRKPKTSGSSYLDGPPPPNYICNRCGIEAMCNWIEKCPQNMDLNYDVKSPAFYKCQACRQSGDNLTTIRSQNTKQGSLDERWMAISLDEWLHEQGDSSSTSKAGEGDRRESVWLKKADLYPPWHVRAGEGDYYRPNSDGKRSLLDGYGWSHYSPAPKVPESLPHDSHREVVAAPKMRGGEKLSDGRLSPWNDFSPVRCRSSEDSGSNKAENQDHAEPSDDGVKGSYARGEPRQHTAEDIVQAYREADTFLASLIEEFGCGLARPERAASNLAATAKMLRLRSESADSAEQAAPRQRQRKKLKMEHNSDFGGSPEHSSMEGVETQTSALEGNTTAPTTPESSSMESIHVELGTPIMSPRADSGNPEEAFAGSEASKTGAKTQLAKPDGEMVLVSLRGFLSGAQVEPVGQSGAVVPYNVADTGNVLEAKQDEPVGASVLDLDTIHPGLITTPAKSWLAHSDAIVTGNPDKTTSVFLSPDPPGVTEKLIPGITKKLLVRQPSIDLLVIGQMRNQDNVRVRRPTRTTAIKMWEEQEVKAKAGLG